MFKKLFGRKTSTTDSLDGKTIAALRGYGADLSKPRDTVHYMYFPSETAAQSAGAAVRDLGLTVVVRAAAKGPEWLVKASHDLVVTPESIAGERRALEAICSSFGGGYDGWEAAAS